MLEACLTSVLRFAPPDQASVNTCSPETCGVKLAATQRGLGLLEEFTVPLNIGVVAPLLLTVIRTPAERVDWPAVSVADAVSVRDPLLVWLVFHWMDQPLAGFESVPMGLPSAKNVTDVTPTSSLALAATVVVPLTVVPEVGDETATDGGESGDPPGPGVVTEKPPEPDTAHTATWYGTPAVIETVSCFGWAVPVFEPTQALLEACRTSMRRFADVFQSNVKVREPLAGGV